MDSTTEYQTIRDARAELLPCPFCGHDDIDLQNVLVKTVGYMWKGVCVKCKASTGLRPDGFRGVIRQWNARVYPSESKMAEESSPERKIWTRAEIKAMNLTEYAENIDAIRLAVAEGRHEDSQ